MSDEQSIRDELVQILDDDPLFGRIGYNHAESLADRFLGSPVIRRIQAEVLREAARSGQVKMFTPAVYVGPERLRVGISAEKWLLEQADRIERGETA